MRIKTTGIALLMTLVLVAASTISPIMASPTRNPEGPFYPEHRVSSARGLPAVSVAPGACGPIDLAIVLDNTGSMGPAITNIIAELPTIISTANTASGGDLKVGFITFNDSVTVKNNLTTNIAAVTANIAAESASGGAGAAEASDEAKNTTINNLLAGTRPDATGAIGTQIGSFDVLWRAGAVKIAVLITDAPPGGFNDIQDLADNINMNTTLPSQASAKGIKFSDVFVNTSGDYAGQKALLIKDASGTGGAFIETPADGSGTGIAIASIVAACGGPVSVPEFPLGIVIPVAGILGLVLLLYKRRGD